MSLLQRISTPDDVRKLDTEQVEQLAQEIRDFLVEKVSATGGHLGPNLGVVELTLGIHRVFNSPEDPIVFDTSHQSYVHKIITGRSAGFDHLRQKDGLSGYTSREESEHDWTESSHASAALSYADGLAKAFELRGEHHRKVVAVVGDGALTGGMCWEALNNIACGEKRNVVIVVNDNGRSYSPTIGGLAANLAELRTMPFYDKVMEQGKSTLKSMGWVGQRTFEALHAFKEGVRSTVLPTEMFPELGIKYIGPVNGHNVADVEQALTYARDYVGPLIVHMVTEKGRGYAPAENDVAELMHSTGVINPKTGEPVGTKSPGWTSVFSKALVEAGEQRNDVVAITAAMAGPTGLSAFGERFPERFFDVGIAEQHALTSAAGLALGGMHPVVAIYSTFLNRAFDQLLMDVGLLQQPVTIVLDRAGVTGSDGASHNGVWDFAITSVVPGIHVAAPRDGEQLQALFEESLDIQGPSVLRFPKGNLPTPIHELQRFDDGVDLLAYHEADADTDTPSVLMIAAGATATAALEAAKQVCAEGLNVTVIDPRWVVPVAPSIIGLASDHDLVVTIEDGVINGGIGSLIGSTLNASEIDVPVRNIAFPEVFPQHQSRSELLAEVQLDADGIRTQTLGWAHSLFDAED